MRESRQTVFERRFGFALNEGQRVLDELFADTLAAFGYPLEGEGLFGVGGKLQRHEHILAHILVGTVIALEDHHFVSLARDGGTHRERARVEGFLDIRLGGEVRAATLHEAEFYGTHLDIESLFDYAAEDTRKPAESGVTEEVVRARLEVADIFAVGGLMKARRERDLLSEGLKLVNLSTSFAALATAVTAISALAGMRGETYAVFNGGFGAAMGLVSAVIGFYMCVKGALYYLRLRGKERVRIIENVKM